MKYSKYTIYLTRRRDNGRYEMPPFGLIFKNIFNLRFLMKSLSKQTKMKIII